MKHQIQLEPRKIEFKYPEKAEKWHYRYKIVATLDMYFYDIEDEMDYLYQLVVNDDDREIHFFTQDSVPPYINEFIIKNQGIYDLVLEYLDTFQCHPSDTKLIEAYNAKAANWRCCGIDNPEGDEPRDTI